MVEREGLIRVDVSAHMCSSSCGCPHEEWDYLGATIAMHQDEGERVSSLVLLDEGYEVMMDDADTFDAAKEQAVAWVDNHMRPNA